MISKLSYYQDAARSLSPYRNLALEKTLLLHTEEGECILYLWQNAGTVVIGKNQNAWKECHISRLTADGGILARRLSGGGAVYHDLGNLNFSFCVRKKDYDVSRQTNVILRAVRGLGIPAERTGRNDLVAAGRKFSGNAYFRSGEYCCHHGTIMVEVDGKKLSAYLNVPSDKLQAKGVDSVRSRVANLKEFNPELTCSMLSCALLRAFCEEYGLEAGEFSPERLDREEIRKEESFFASWDFIYGRRLPFTHRLEARYAWGNLELLMKVDEGRILDVICYSDSMEPEALSGIPARIKGHRYKKEELLALFPPLDKVSEGIRELIDREL